MICEIPHKMDFLATNERQESLQDSLRRSSVKLGTMQRIFAWPNTCVHVLDPLCICMCPCMCLHMVYVRARLLARSRRRRHIQTCARMRGWRNTVEANLEFDETVPSVVHAHTSNLRPAKDPFAPTYIDEVSNHIPPTSQLRFIRIQVMAHPVLSSAAIASDCLHAAKGGAVETGCSDLYGVIYYVIM